MNNTDSTKFTEPEENNRFSIITQVIIRANAFYSIFYFSSSGKSRNRAAVIFKIRASVIITSRDYSKICRNFRPINVM